MVQYYTISYDYNRKTPYAPTIVNSGEVFLSKCPKCGRIRYNYANREISLLIEGKGKLPDYLMCGHYPLMIVSDRVLNIWEKAGITGYTSFLVELVDYQMDKIRDVQYHNIIVTGKAELDFTKMGIKIKKVCSKCGAVEYNKQTWEFGTAIMKESTYDHSDLFVLNFFPTAPLCTIKVLETVHDNKLKSFKFQYFAYRMVVDQKKYEMTAVTFTNLNTTVYTMDGINFSHSREDLSSGKYSSLESTVDPLLLPSVGDQKGISYNRDGDTYLLSNLSGLEAMDKYQGRETAKAFGQWGVSLASDATMGLGLALKAGGVAGSMVGKMVTNANQIASTANYSLTGTGIANNVSQGRSFWNAIKGAIPFYGTSQNANKALATLDYRASYRYR